MTQDVHPIRTRSPLRGLGKAMLGVYWIGCLGVIGFGLDRLYPEVRPALVATPLAQSAVQTVAPYARYDRPFATCAEAHAVGVYDIPAGSPAYTPRQDGDDDGLACEPPRS